MGLTCIDISTWQNKVDFNKVKKAGITTIIMRIGYGNSVSQKDKWFEHNYKEAKAKGFKIGGYWYSYASGVSDAEREAKACIQCIQGKSFDLPIYYDLEDASQTHLGKTTLTAMAKKFCNSVKAAGYSVGVYANLNWFKNYLDYTELKGLYSIWLAHLTDKPGLDCDIWQFSFTQKVDGISGNVDGNKIMNTSLPGGSSNSAATTSSISSIASSEADPLAYEAATTAGIIAQDQVYHENIDNYILTIDRRTTDLQYNKWKKAGVVGVVIEAGYLYDKSHIEKTNFKNPKLRDQAMAASAANVPFGLYTTVRARNIAEAKKELNELTYCIQIYPPSLGVWLKLDLGNHKSRNNKILDEYYSTLRRLGLRDKIGLYVNRSQLNQIKWKEYQDKFYLWLNDHVDKIDEIDKLLDPEFFMLNN